jgi:hypothetical protein
MNFGLAGMGGRDGQWEGSKTKRLGSVIMAQKQAGGGGGEEGEGKENREQLVEWIDAKEREEQWGIEISVSNRQSVREGGKVEKAEGVSSPRSQY